MADINKILMKLTKPNPEYEGDSKLKNNAEENYKFLLGFKGTTDEYDDLLNQFRKALDSWKLYPNIYAVNSDQRDEIVSKAKELAELLEEKVNFQMD